MSAQTYRQDAQDILCQLDSTWIHDAAYVGFALVGCSWLHVVHLEGGTFHGPNGRVISNTYFPWKAKQTYNSDNIKTKKTLSEAQRTQIIDSVVGLGYKKTTSEM